MKKCPACAEEVQDAAVKCKHCGKSLKKSFWSGSWILLVILFFIICANSNKSTNAPSSTPAPQTFEEKYPNVYAFVDDFRNSIRRGVATDRLNNLMSSDPNWNTQHIYEQGFGDTYIGQNGELAPAFQCVDRFIKEHVEDSSCEVSERVLISHNYLGSSEKHTDTKDIGNGSNAVQSDQATSGNTESNYFASSENQTDTMDTDKQYNKIASQVASDNTQTDNLANSYTLNVPNSQGGYTSIVITKSGDGYNGPQGKHFSQFPTVAQLQSAYGLN